MKKILVGLLLTAPLLASDLNLGWTAGSNADETTSYNLYMATGSNGPFVFYGNTTNMTMTVTNLSPGVYQFYATATNMWGESGPSNTVKTPAGKPGSIIIKILK